MLYEQRTSVLTFFYHLCLLYASCFSYCIMRSVIANINKRMNELRNTGDRINSPSAAMILHTVPAYRYLPTHLTRTTWWRCHSRCSTSASWLVPSSSRQWLIVWVANRSTWPVSTPCSLLDLPSSSRQITSHSW